MRRDRLAGVGPDLASWHDGETKDALLRFIERVTEPGPSFVQQSRRVATFDNDGTLWCEKPMHPQADFLIRRWALQIAAEPAKARKQPWKAVAERDDAWLRAALHQAPDL